MKQETTLPLAQTKQQRAFWNKLRPVNIPAACDTYKRTMSGSSTLFADNFACYSLAARKSLEEEGTNGRLIMAGLEKLLYPWFMEPVTEEEVCEAQEFFTKYSQVKKFPTNAWKSVLDNGGYFPIDIYALPGGQTFLVKDGKHIPFMSVEGPGALVTHLEPHLEHAFAPLIHATKARLFKEAVGNKFAEFGYRADQEINNHVNLLHALYVGAGFSLTSDDQAVFLFPEYFKDIGTVGHEFIMAYQKKGRSLEEAQMLAYEDFVAKNQRSALLPDVISTLRSGLPAILELVRRYQKINPEKIIMPRFDSGDVPEQCIHWKRMNLLARIPKTTMVVEDGYTPKKAEETYNRYALAGFNPDDIITGAGGYFQHGCTRDALSLVFKRSATMHDTELEESLKFSDSPGKESIPGQIRIYGRDRTLIVAQAHERIDGATMLSRKVLSQGRIVNAEDLFEQAARANETWNQYESIEYSPETKRIIQVRTAERDEILKRYSKEGAVA